jgi:hypothetical protein
MTRSLRAASNARIRTEPVYVRGLMDDRCFGHRNPRSRETLSRQEGDPASILFTPIVDITLRSQCRCGRRARPGTIKVTMPLRKS